MPLMVASCFNALPIKLPIESSGFYYLHDLYLNYNVIIRAVFFHP